MNYHLDFETFSEADLKSVGVYRYARDPSCEVLCLAVSRGHEKPLLWVPPVYASKLAFIDPMEQEEARATLDEMMSNESNLVYAHNAAFEQIVWNEVMVKQHGFSPLRPEQMRCTALMARRACIPPSLGKCAEYLRLDQKKDARGATLIRKFCLPQKCDKTHAQTWRRFPQDDPALFKEFCEYCIQDVVTELAIGDALKLFDVGGVSSKAVAVEFDVNDRGFPVDLAALSHAQQMIDNELVRVQAAFTSLTGLNPTQTGAFLIWLRERGYSGEDLRGATMDEELEDWDEADTTGLDANGIKALELRRLMSYAAVKKIRAMLNVAGPDDNKVRGTLLNHGASTGRFSSRTVQSQNFKRSTKESEAFFIDLRKGYSQDSLELVHGPIMENIAGSIRHFINDGDRPLVATDFSAIEARTLAWLAGQQDALDEYAAGVDRYKVMASHLFNVPVSAVTKEQRFLGKTLVLGAGYSLGATKLQLMCQNFGVEISEELAQLSIKTFRKVHNKVVAFWYDLERAARSVINNPGTKVVVGKLKFFTIATAGRRFMMIRLPSGRHLSYPDPAIEDDKITYFGQIPMKASWGRVTTFTGRLAENVTSAASADLMVESAYRAMEQGYHIIMLVHDEVVATTDTPDFSLDDFEKCILTLPTWAEGLPLNGESSALKFYSK
jgi:DNA polymerase